MSNREMPSAPEAAVQPAADAAPQAPAKEPSRLIAVVALRDGFYGGQRMKPGQKFNVKSMQDLGSWMKCEDPKIEAKRPKTPMQTIRSIVPKAGN